MPCNFSIKKRWNVCLNGDVSDIKIRQAKLELTQELYHMLRILYLVLYSGYIIAIVEKRDCTNSYLKANRVSIAITSIVTPQTRYAQKLNSLTMEFASSTNTTRGVQRLPSNTLIPREEPFDRFQKKSVISQISSNGPKRWWTDSVEL
jgi:hypothetical protein